MSAWRPSPLLTRLELLAEQAQILRQLADLDDPTPRLHVDGGREAERRVVLKSHLAAVQVALHGPRAEPRAPGELDLAALAANTLRREDS